MSSTLQIFPAHPLWIELSLTYAFKLLLFYFLSIKFIFCLHLNSKVCKPFGTPLFVWNLLSKSKRECCSYITYTQVKQKYVRWTVIIALHNVVPFLPCIYMPTLIRLFLGNKPISWQNAMEKTASCYLNVQVLRTTENSSSYHACGVHVEGPSLFWPHQAPLWQFWSVLAELRQWPAFR